MNFSKKDSDKIFKWLETRGVFNKKCFACEESKWSLINGFYQIRQLKGEYSQPVISVRCENCGNTLFFNTITMGIFKVNQDIS